MCMLSAKVLADNWDGQLVHEFNFISPHEDMISPLTQTCTT